MQNVLQQSQSSLSTGDTHEVLHWHLRRWNSRLRTTRSVTWLPRGLILGVLVGMALAIISRFRPWLLPEEIFQASLGALGVSGALTMLIIWLWPRPVTRSAQDFDQRFELKERISTALELTNGQLFAPEFILAPQLEDARIAANRVKPEESLPLQVRWIEVAILVGLLIGLAASLLLDNPLATEALAQRELNEAIDEQARQLEETRDEILNSQELTEEQKDELVQPLEEAIETLEQDDISQAEAVAALDEAEKQLEEMSRDGLSPEERQAYNNAAQPLNQNPQTEGISEQLEEGDLEEAAEELEETSNAFDGMSQEELNELADQLEAAAEALEETNPELAEQLREAADALREGDTQRAQEALQEAAEGLQEQAGQNQQQANEAGELSEQVSGQRQEMTEFGQEGQQGQQGENSQEGQQSESQQGNQSQQSQTGSQQGEQESQQEGQQPQAGNQGEGEGQQTEVGESAEGQNQGNQQGSNEGESAEGSQTEGNTGQSQSAEGQQQPSTANSQQPGGSGAGDQGEQHTESQSGQENQPGEVSNNPGDTEMREYDEVYDPTRIGDDGEGTDEAVQGQPNSEEGETIDEQRLNENFEGESRVQYNQVFEQYRGEAQKAIESDYIPLGLRDLIRAYFSSIEP